MYTSAIGLFVRLIWCSFSLLLSKRPTNLNSLIYLFLFNFESRKRLSSLELALLFRLGLYNSVVAAKTRKRLGGGGHFVRAISFAFCGMTEDTRTEITSFCRCWGANWNRSRLAELLAIFLPMDALNLMEGRRMSPYLRLQLFLRNGLQQQAAQYHATLSFKEFRRRPELHLLSTNVLKDSPVNQLNRLNIFLSSQGLSPVDLRNPSLPPSPLNITSTGPIAHTKGPLVTVLMTTFRIKERVSAAIESVLSQSWHNIELIIVDDASGDDTLEHLRTWTAKDSRIRVIPLKCNVGTYAAKLIGLKQAQGEFVTCHDADDWSHPEKIARQVLPLLNDPKLIGSVSGMVRMQDDGQFCARWMHSLIQANYSSLLFRRERVLSEIGAWDCSRAGSDEEFWKRLQLVYGTRSIKLIKTPLALCSERSDSLTTMPDTGSVVKGRFSPNFIEYREAMNRWHMKTIASGSKPYITPDVLANAMQRPFELPKDWRVSVENLKNCLNALNPR